MKAVAGIYKKNFFLKQETYKKNFLKSKEKNYKTIWTDKQFSPNQKIFKNQKNYTRKKNNQRD